LSFFILFIILGKNCRNNHKGVEWSLKSIRCKQKTTKQDRPRQEYISIDETIYISKNI